MVCLQPSVAAIFKQIGYQNGRIISTELKPLTSTILPQLLTVHVQIPSQPGDGEMVWQGPGCLSDRQNADSENYGQQSPIGHGCGPRMTNPSDPIISFNFHVLVHDTAELAL